MGSRTAQGRRAPRHDGARRVAFRFSLQRRRPGHSTFRGSIPSPPFPLSTLRRRPRERRRITRGRCGRLPLQRTTLSFASIHRPPGAQRRLDPSSLWSANASRKSVLRHARLVEIYRCFQWKRSPWPKPAWLASHAARTSAPTPSTASRMLRRTSSRCSAGGANGPDALAGLPMGPTTGLWALDLDVNRQTGEPIGKRALAAVVAIDRATPAQPVGRRALVLSLPRRSARQYGRARRWRR